jgi:integrase
LQIASQIDFPKVRIFPESIARGSKSSKNTYEIGLKHLQSFLGIINSSSINRNNNNSPTNCNRHYNIETILLALQSNKLNVYELLDGFVSYLVNMPHQPPIAPTSVTLYVCAVRSYLQYHDIDINPSKFRCRVRLPKVPREDERPIDASEIRSILLACNNRRVKAYMLVLASGGMRAMEGLAIRYRDLDFSVSPTRVHIRKEFTKTKVARDIYISDESTKYLKQWLDWKYPEARILKTGKRTSTTPMPDDLVFSPFLGSTVTAAGQGAADGGGQAGIAAGGGASSGGAAGGPTINILEGSAVQGNPDYDPDELTVAAGSDVTVTNQDTAPHTATSGTGPQDPNAGQMFDTSIINGGESATLSLAQVAAGRYDYHV